MKSAQQLWLEQVRSPLETLNEGVIINDERKQIVFANSKFPGNDQNERRRSSGTVDRQFVSP